MLRILLTIVIGSVIGVILGRLQASVANSGYEERFIGSRATLAEVRGDATQAEVAAQSTGTPKLEVVGGTEFDFGTMLHGETLSHEFVFRNAGDGPLNLDMGGSTCKCTVGELESSILKPGEETVVKLTWTAQSLSPQYVQTATLLTNDAAHAEVQLRVKGQIADSFVIEPPSLSLGDVPATQSMTRTAHVFTYLEDSTALEDFRWSDAKTYESVSIEARKVDLDPVKFPNHKSAKSVHEVTLTLQPGLPLGPLNARISFDTDQGEDVGTFSIPVTGRVVGEIVLLGGPSFDPKLNVIDLGTIRSGEGASVGISIAVQGPKRDDIELEVEAIKPAESLTVTLGEPRSIGSRKVFPLRFEVPKGAPETYYAGTNPKDFGKVIITTNHELIKEIPVYVRMNVVK